MLVANQAALAHHVIVQPNDFGTSKPTLNAVWNKLAKALLPDWHGTNRLIPAHSSAPILPPRAHNELRCTRALSEGGPGDMRVAACQAKLARFCHHRGGRIRRWRVVCARRLRAGAALASPRFAWAGRYTGRAQQRGSGKRPGPCRHKPKIPVAWGTVCLYYKEYGSRHSVPHAALSKNLPPTGPKAPRAPSAGRLFARPQCPQCKKGREFRSFQAQH